MCLRGMEDGHGNILDTDALCDMAHRGRDAGAVAGAAPDVRELVKRLRKIAGPFYDGGHLLTDDARASMLEAAALAAEKDKK